MRRRWSGNKSGRGHAGQAGAHLLSRVDPEGHALHRQGELGSVSQTKVPELDLSPLRPGRPGCTGGQPPGSLGGETRGQRGPLQGFPERPPPRACVLLRAVGMFTLFFRERKLYLASQKWLPFISCYH